jgi:hypothetical protein
MRLKMNGIFKPERHKNEFTNAYVDQTNEETNRRERRTKQNARRTETPDHTGRQTTCADDSGVGINYSKAVSLIETAKSSMWPTFVT